jgi:hypothetical protein
MSDHKHESQNPFASPKNLEKDTGKESSPFFTGILCAIFYSILALVGCVVLVLVAKGIDWLIPGEGALANSSIQSVCWENRLLFLVITMLSGFSAFAYHAGQKRINSGLCLIAVFCGGILARTVLSWWGLITLRPSRDETSLYPSEIITYLVAYATMSLVLILIGNRLASRVKSISN